MLSWLQASMGVFQAAASSSDFFAKAAQAVVDIVGLDSGTVLLWQNDKWESQACYWCRRPAVARLKRCRADGC